MTNRLYKRACKVTVYRTTPVGFVASNPQFFADAPNATEITDLRVQFKIEKSLDSTPNTCEVTITNCASTTRALLQSKPLRVQIDAGYDGQLKHVFTGDLRWGLSSHTGVDWETKLQLADGDRAYRYARVSRSYRKGTSVITALKDVAAAWGLQLPSSVTTSTDLQSQFATGRSLHGPARDEMTRLLEPFGYHWSFQDGQLRIVKDQNADPTLALVWNQSTGMIGSPEYAPPEKNKTIPTLKSSALLYPEVTPGGSVELSSLDINGIFRVNKLTHAADTHGDDWKTEIEATPRPGAVAA